MDADVPPPESAPFGGPSPVLPTLPDPPDSPDSPVPPVPPDLPDAPPPTGGLPESPDAVPPTPAVVAVVVVRGEAPHLDACLAALATSDYPELTVVVVAGRRRTSPRGWRRRCPGRSSGRLTRLDSPPGPTKR